MMSARRTALTGAAIAALAAPLALAVPAHAARPAIYTQPQIAAQLLTMPLAAKATGFKGKLAKDAGNTYCNTNGTYNICMNGWMSKADAPYPASVSIWSMPTAADASTTLGQYVALLGSAGFRKVNVETSPAVMVYETERNGGDTDTVTVLTVNGTAMTAGSCQRPASHKSIGAVVTCAQKLAKAQNRQAPPG
jgi:hypothetical protein